MITTASTAFVNRVNQLQTDIKHHSGTRWPYMKTKIEHLKDIMATAMADLETIESNRGRIDAAYEAFHSYPLKAA
jgi:hypothetical protein